MQSFIRFKKDFKNRYWYFSSVNKTENDFFEIPIHETKSKITPTKLLVGLQNEINRAGKKTNMNSASRIFVSETCVVW